MKFNFAPVVQLRRWLLVLVFLSLVVLALNLALLCSSTSTRWLCWALLLLSSFPLHVVYNSAVLASQATTEYIIAELDAGFLDDADAAMSALETNWTMIGENPNAKWPGYVEESRDRREYFKDSIVPNAARWENLTLEACASTYSGVMFTMDRNLILVVPPEDPPRRLPGLVDEVAYNNWMSDAGAPERNLAPAEPAYCLAEPFRQQCDLEVYTAFLVTVIVCNIVRTAVMLAVFFVARGRSLNTLGDAITSFLKRPDPSAKGVSDMDTPGKAVTPCAIAVVLGLVIMAVAADSDSGRLATSFSPSSFLVKDYASVVGWDALVGASFASLVVLVNTPQVLFSALYFMYNSLLSCFLQAAEWNALSLKPQTLRVSRPEQGRISRQRPAYWLQVAPAYALPLLIFSAASHWLIYQSLFLSKIIFTGYRGQLTHSTDRLSWGRANNGHEGEILVANYSSLVGVRRSLLQLASMLGNGVRNCRCASLADTLKQQEHEMVDSAGEDDDDDWMRPLMWGEIGRTVEAGSLVEKRCYLGLTAGPVEVVVKGR
ncbi:hypothetical protein CSOJ01_11519 [Colletotrichum sojae]|uniref:DUF6536 domain-containing protein n=1 Tax=Colletotrichum sojae TaxID=2175907 RepID=A0A8H6IY15_9PEZI|nr:hypothetical protein CSOJ01_11519 [Colletotrichum sojae]